MDEKKVRFGKLGFILAASGSAVGLGNIWKFPYITGENGGGIFVLVYLATVFSIGISIFIAEVLMGRNSHTDAVSTFEVLAPKGKKGWRIAGFTIFTGLLILSFYSVVIGWILNYIVIALTNLPSSVEESEKVFMAMLTQDISSQIIYFTIAFIIITYIVSQGLKKGIEKFSKILMPILMMILAIMLIYSFSLDGFSQAVEFMFYPNVEKFKTSSIILAVGHAFFTLSVGMAVIMTYSASIDRKTNIVKASIVVVMMDTVIAIVAGLIIFSVLYSSGAEPSKGPGLVFISLPAIFYQMGAIGNILAILFFIALAFAGITSAISILEPMVMYLEKRLKINRIKGVIATSTILYILSIFALLSNTKEFGEALTFGSKNLFDWVDFVTGSIFLPLGGVLVAVFVGYVMDKTLVKKELEPLMGRFFYSLWMIFIRYITPIAIILVMLNQVGIIKI